MKRSKIQEQIAFTSLLIIENSEHYKWYIISISSSKDYKQPLDLDLALGEITNKTKSFVIEQLEEEHEA